ncbi:hypothetical protein [Streptomyces odonnellii]|uniref:hypothetical protein n=1 Tax=Streptomyces odonnellii TaxID=1417980 RepID=UPI0012FF55A2|nr:hypothetical protein [Streptomyces odonnellii]
MDDAVSEAGRAFLRTLQRGQVRRGVVSSLVNFDVLIRDDLPRGVHVISRLLHHHQAAETAVLKHAEKPYELIPLVDPSA